MKVAVSGNPTDLAHGCCYKVGNLDWIAESAVVDKDFASFLEEKTLLDNTYFLTVSDNSYLED